MFSYIILPSPTFLPPSSYLPPTFLLPFSCLSHTFLQKENPDAKKPRTVAWSRMLKTSSKPAQICSAPAQICSKPGQLHGPQNTAQICSEPAPSQLCLSLLFLSLVCVWLPVFIIIGPMSFNNVGVLSGHVVVVGHQQIVPIRLLFECGIC